MRIVAGPSWGTRVVAGVVAGALVVGQAPNVWAQSAGDKPVTPGATTAPSATAPSGDINAAKRHYASGEKKFKAGDFAGALPDFREANDIKSTPQAERYIGLCEDALGHYAEATDWYDRFLGHVPDKMGAQGDETRKRQAEIRAMPGKVHVDSNPPGADVTIDERSQTSPTPLDVELPPGTHKVAFKEAGRLPAEKVVDVAFASSQTVSVDLEPEPPPPPPPVAVVVAPPPAVPTVPPASTESRSRVPAYVTGVLAIAAAGVGTAFGILALNDKSKFDQNPTTHTADNGDTHSLVADMSFGVAITLAVTSIVLFVTRDEAAPTSVSMASKTMTAKLRDAREHSIRWSATPIVGAHTGGAGLGVQF